MKRCYELLNYVQYTDDTTLHIIGGNLNVIDNTMNVQLWKKLPLVKTQ